MITGQLINVTTRYSVVPNVQRTTTAWERFAGLMGRPAMATDDALLIDPCASVHTFFMRFPIDLVYLNHEFTVVKTVESMSPWRMSAAFGARTTLELASGRIRALEISVGQRLAWLEDE